MKTMHYLRKTTTVVSGAALLLALAGSAFAGGSGTTGGGHTAVTTLQGVTITGTTVGTSFVYTVSLDKTKEATFTYAGGTGTIDKIGGFFIFSSPQVTTTGPVQSGFSPVTISDGNGPGNITGATGYSTSYGSGTPLLPGDIGKFRFNTSALTGATFLLDISQGATGPFSPTGKISFMLLPSPSAVPEPSSVATLAVGSLGLMGMVLSARKRRRANDMI